MSSGEEHLYIGSKWGEAAIDALNKFPTVTEVISLYFTFIEHNIRVVRGLV